MKGTKRISDLITTQDALKKGQINIIDAGVSAGKTYFALTTLPKWTNPDKILYLIDTTNGEMRIQQNIITIGRMDYALWDYNTGAIWGVDTTKGRLPVMTYAGFGSETRKAGSKFNWFDFDYIVCDEMQNLVDYQRFNDRSKNLEAAEDAIRAVIAEGTTTVVAMSATPQKIRERFAGLCYEVPFDREDLCTLCTSACIPYRDKVEDMLLKLKGKTGILYTTQIEDMKKYIEYGNSIGIRTGGFWSAAEATQKKHPFTPEQWNLRKMVLEEEIIPDDIDLLIINRASETCIKIQEKKRKVDFIIVHDKNPEIQTQVRGRYHGDLSEFYYHDYDAWNMYQIQTHPLPAEYLGKRLYTEDLNDLRWILNILTPDGRHYGNPTIFKYLEKCGYSVSESKKDSKNHGKRYRIITAKCTAPELLL